ncbi:hypothetical protein CEXT_369461 [Caerostris extrusa]|uniref:Ycf1 n=1 Tax=Caerostris extrusa TaxID=172846 RepID=A0AAV4SPN3_CAEEX|nr:hypothetical protein CEXT_369461 [Caerostris extrusa]
MIIPWDATLFRSQKKDANKSHKDPPHNLYAIPQKNATNEHSEELFPFETVKSLQDRKRLREKQAKFHDQISNPTFYDHLMGCNSVRSQKERCKQSHKDPSTQLVFVCFLPNRKEIFPTAFCFRWTLRQVKQ